MIQTSRYPQSVLGESLPGNNFLNLKTVRIAFNFDTHKSGNRLLPTGERDSLQSSGVVIMNQLSSDDNAILLPPTFHPSDNDVICGWARQFQNHEGNRRFRELIKLSIPSYLAAKQVKSEKSHLIASIIDKVESESPQGGFVKGDTATGRWYKLTGERVRDKVGHAIRKAAERFEKRKKGHAKHPKQSGSISIDRSNPSENQPKKHGSETGDKDGITERYHQSQPYPQLAGNRQYPSFATGAFGGVHDSAIVDLAGRWTPATLLTNTPVRTVNDIPKQSLNDQSISSTGSSCSSSQVSQCTRSMVPERVSDQFSTPFFPSGPPGRASLPNHFSSNPHSDLLNESIAFQKNNTSLTQPILRAQHGFFPSNAVKSDLELQLEQSSVTFRKKWSDLRK